MLKKTTLHGYSFSALFLLLPLLYSPIISAQCAGDDASLSYCSKEEGQFIELSEILGGTPQSGGTWSDNDQDRGLNTATGTLDTYAVMTGGVFEYTYTISDDNCTDTTAVVTLTLGAYAGHDNNNAVVCADTDRVNLFQFSGSSPSPTIDGEWSSLSLPDDVLSGPNKRFFEVSEVMPGRYDFIYTVPAYDDCPASKSTVVLEVAETPDSGTFVQPVFCESDDLSNFTNYNLREVLVGEDPGGIWSETSATNEISGFGDSYINLERLRNTIGPGIYSFTYTVNPVNPTCSSSATTVTVLIEDVLDFSGTTFTLSQEDAVCIDALPITVSGTIDVDTTKVPDGNYQITYEVSGGENAGTENLIVNIVQGTADFNINPEFFTAAAEVIVEITKIVDPNTQTNCQIPLEGVSDGFTINPLPDVTDTAIEVFEPICFGEDLNVSLSDSNDSAIELLDGTYTITYELTSQNAVQTGTDTITVTGGNATFTVSSNLMETAGAATLTINQITAGNGCATQVDLSDSFTVSPKPDAAGLIINIPATCDGEPVIVNLASGENSSITDGIYSISYSLSGASTAENESVDSLVFTDGKATFNLPQEILNTGTSSITITGLQNANTGCAATNLDDPSATFTVTPYPDLSASILTIVSVCESQQVSLNIDDNNTAIPDGTYNLVYILTFEGQSSNYNATTAFAEGNGTLNFPAEAVNNPCSYTFSLDSFQNTAQSCPATGLPRETSFEIFERPDLASATLAVTSVCFGEPVIANLSGADLEDGDFLLTYSINGSTTVEEQEVNATFTAGATSFNIPEEFLQDSGEYMLDILRISKENDSVNCSTETVLATNFSINAQPVLDDVTLSLDTALCLGDSATVNVASANANLVDGDYTFTYSLSGANTTGDQMQELNVASGVGSFTIPATLLVNAGSTQLMVSRVTNNATTCFTDPENLSFNFSIALPPDLNGAALTIADFCAASGNQTLSISAPNLSNGIYDFTYTLTGANSDTQTANGLEFINGAGSFELSESLIGNSGETTVTVIAVASETCRTENLSISTSFEIYDIPQLEEENLAVASVCLGENTLFTISGSGLQDGNYDLSYSLNGANTLTAQSITIDISNGSADFMIAAQNIDQAGATTLTVESLQNNPTTCQSASAVATSFEIYPIPTIDQANISAMDVCFGEAGMLSFNGATALADGDYSVTYALSGANGSSSNIETFTINNAEGILEIPAEQLSATGNTTITVAQIVSEAGCTSGPINVSATFEILSRPDAEGLTINVAAICLNTTATAIVSGATNLIDGEYTITYQLDGANTQTQTEDVVFESGETSFTIAPALLLNAGNTSIHINQIQDFISQCGALNLDGADTTFAIDDPEPPSLMSNGNAFCINDNPTAADLLSRLTPSEGITLYGSEKEDDTLPSTTPLVNGATYYASQTNAMGCEGSVRLAITIDLTGCDAIFIPEAFSPNGDGVNDRFVIENIDVVYPNYSIEIFNRNGNAVYKGYARNGTWDGTANQHQLGNKILPNGVYFYIINYNDGETAPVQGNLYLNR